jgi:hypothetical protein
MRTPAPRWDRGVNMPGLSLQNKVSCLLRVRGTPCGAAFATKVSSGAGDEVFEQVLRTHVR